MQTDHSEKLPFAPVILVVDDEPLYRELIIDTFHDSNYRFVEAANGEAAWALLNADPEHFDIILLDRDMPHCNGLELLRRMKKDRILKTIPVIFQSGMSDARDIQQGMELGAYYYLSKPYQQKQLITVLTTAIRERYHYYLVKQQLQQQQQTPQPDLNFSFCTLDEIYRLSSLVAGMLPNADLAAIGIFELMLNAIEHGNLGINYHEKGVLIEQGLWEEEIMRRLGSLQSNKRLATLSVERQQNCITITICDQGEGFNWQQYLNFDINRLMDNHGRGIAMANHCGFSSLTFLGNGNCARISVDLTTVTDPQQASELL
ncbi:MAG: response regulator [Gammaproteobacteria bacterium]|nr:response regulator [Gammaproteobacteria bacterium]